MNRREHIDDIKEEVVRCQQLLENIFAPEVLERLKAKAAVDGEGAGEIIAEEFDECSFLFAKAQTPRDSPRFAEIR